MKFIKLTKKSGWPIWVNFENVVAIYHYSGGSAGVITCGGSEILTKETPEQILEICKPRPLIDTTGENA